MKKLFVMLSIATMIFAFAGCGTTGGQPQETTAAPTEATAETAQTTAAPTTQAATQAQTQAPAGGDIGLEKAKEIALQDAGIDAANATFIEQRADIDDGLNVYDIEFVSAETEYSYEIEAATGTIRERSSESVYDD